MKPGSQAATRCESVRIPRGAALALLALAGFAPRAAEALRPTIAAIVDELLDRLGGRDAIESMMLRTARATCDFYIENTPADGVPYWDTGLWYCGSQASSWIFS